MMRTGPAHQLPPGTGAFGLAIFLGSLGTLFAGSLAAFWVVRGRAESWAEDLPALPQGLWLSTAVLMLLSWVAQRSVVRLRAGNRVETLKLLWAAVALALVFVVVQWLNWQALIRDQLPPTSSTLYAFTFYLLTGLHALHVLGGVVYSGLVCRRIRKGSTLGEGEAVANQANYWHFLGVVWVFLLVTLLGAATPTLDREGIARLFTGLTLAAAVPNIWYWWKTLRALFQSGFFMQGVVSIFPVMAYLFAWMRAPELGLRGVALRWFLSFAALLFCLSIRLGVVGFENQVWS